ncbi:L-threonylcarbamoyladenylate synthase [Sedimentitalea sp. HM32M-2]|uniref:L-threonylcarbamoyladenylate synthase n=1 Tax=Sedimentitalea sp. HM32M-2 TaxID=3351566 RepID=UPI00363A7D08
MSGTNTVTLSTSVAHLAQAANLLTAGECIAFPTETVYGLGADARSGTAVAKVFAAKGRPAFNPLIVHVPDATIAQRHVIWSDTADRLASAFWPGPLTLVLPLRAEHGIAPLVTAGLDSLAVRVPAQSIAQRLMHMFGGPLAAPSANLSGQISATQARHVLAGLQGKIAAVVDDGPCPVGLESTIVGLTGDRPVLLRPGGLPVEVIETALGHTLARAGDKEGVTAPGQLQSHYAPAAALRLQARFPRAGELLLGFGPMDCDLNLSQTGDLTEAAANLFGHLHKLDRMSAMIAVAPVPDHGLGLAINDRLRRAAAPRDT